MEELDLKELISMFLEKKVLIILVVIIFALVGAIYTLKFITPIYQSSTSLILAQATIDNQTGEITNSITASDINLNANLVDNYKSIAESRIVAQRVKENLGLDLSIDAIQASTTVSTVSDTEVLNITVSNTDPELACEIANEIAKVFTERAIEIYKVDNVNVLDEAVVPSSPSNINLFKNVVIFAFVGLILVAGYILLINMLDTTIKTDADIERTVHLPVLASIVLTDDSQKKKKSTGKRSRSSLDLDFTPSTSKQIQELTKNDKQEVVDDNISMFSYMHKDEKYNQEKSNNKNNNNQNNNQKNNNGKNSSNSKSGGNKSSQRKKKNNNNRRKDDRK